MNSSMFFKNNWLFYNFKETILIVSLYWWVALSSIINMGSIAPVGFLGLLFLCAFYKPRTGLIALIAMFYLPIWGLGLPMAFVLSSAIVLSANIFHINKQNYRVTKPLIMQYCIFLLLRSVSIVFVENGDAFQSYLFVSFSVFIHLLIIPTLVYDSTDIKIVLHFWGLIGALSAILGFLHFQFQDVVYLRQIFTASGAFDKSAIGGSFDFVRWIWAGAEPNFTGLQLLIPLVINLSSASKDKSILSIVLTSITFLGIFGTYSRTSLIVSIFVTAIYFILYKSYSKYFALILAPIAFLCIYMYFPEFVERALSINEALDDGGSGRFPLFSEAIDNFCSNPLFGIGTGQTATVSKYHLESHNLYLQILAENGFFSLLLIVIIFWKYLRITYRYKQSYLLYFVAGLAVMLNACSVSLFDMRLLFTLFLLFYLNYYYDKSEFIGKQ